MLSRTFGSCKLTKDFYYEVLSLVNVMLINK